ncbi:MAG: FtsQ-type POTRA domain-containing protein [Nitrospira sp.]|nr:FtsQ-type POTRA domain-containing protein [Nitrospira sp.]
MVRWTGAMIGVVVTLWLITLGVSNAGPFLERLFEIQDVTVDGLHRLDRQEILDLVQLAPRTPLYRVSTVDIQGRVEAHPWIKQATVALLPLHELHISVVERLPGALVQVGKEIFLVDQEGQVLAPWHPREGEPSSEELLPVVSGVDRKGLLEGAESVRRAIVAGIELADSVRQTYSGPLHVNVADPTNLIVSVGGTRFHFGEEGRNEQWERFQQVKRVVRELEAVGEGDVSDVDLRYENRVVVRERG